MGQCLSEFKFTENSCWNFFCISWNHISLPIVLSISNEIMQKSANFFTQNHEKVGKLPITEFTFHPNGEKWKVHVDYIHDPSLVDKYKSTFVGKNMCDFNYVTSGLKYRIGIRNYVTSGLNCGRGIHL